MTDAAGHLPASCTVTIACDHWTEPRHPIVIAPDWTVTTPHDLESDAIAVALGAQSYACIHLDDDVHRARRAYEAIRRQRLPDYLSALSPLTASADDDRFLAAQSTSRTSLDILCALLHKFGDNTLRMTVDGTSLGPGDTLSGEVVVPGAVISLMRSPTFIEVCEGIAASPVPDHETDSAVPGCTRWRADRSNTMSSVIDRVWARSLSRERAGNRRAQARFYDGHRVITVERPSGATSFPSANPRVVSNPIDADVPLHRLSVELNVAAGIAEVGTRFRQCNAFAREMHRAGEYAESIIWLVSAYEHQRAPWPVRLSLVLFALLRRGALSVPDDPGLAAIVNRHLVLAAPELYGLPREFTNLLTLATEPIAGEIDLGGARTTHPGLAGFDSRRDVARRPRCRPP